MLEVIVARLIVACWVRCETDRWRVHSLRTRPRTFFSIQSLLFTYAFVKLSHPGIPTKAQKPEDDES